MVRGLGGTYISKQNFSAKVTPVSISHLHLFAARIKGENVSFRRSIHIKHLVHNSIHINQSNTQKESH